MTYRSIYLEKLTKVVAMIAEVWWPCDHPPFRSRSTILLFCTLFFLSNFNTCASRFCWMFRPFRMKPQLCLETFGTDYPVKRRRVSCQWKSLLILLQLISDTIKIKQDIMTNNANI